MKNLLSKMMMVSAMGVVVMMASRAWAIVPISYTYDANDPRFYLDTGGLLTDGVVGAGGPAGYTDLAWVGFRTGGGYAVFPIGVTFDFGSPYQFTGINIFGLNSISQGIAPLTTFTVSYSNDGVTYGGAQTFTTTGAEQAGPFIVSDFARTLSGSGRYIYLTMDANVFEPSQPFLFISEVDFVGVPEPSTVALLGLGGLVLAWRRRRATQAGREKKRNHVAGKIMMAGMVGFGMMLASQTWAALIVPVSYSYDPSPVVYGDTGNTELKDGIIGTNSDGPSYTPWVGFHSASQTFPVKITFDFGAVTNFAGAQISIFGLNWPSGAVDPLTTFTVSYSNDGSTFGGSQIFPTTLGEQAGNPAVGIYTRSLTGSGQYIKLEMDHVRNPAHPYLMISEVQFNTVPEPSTVALLTVGGLLLFRRRSASYGGQGRRTRTGRME